MVEVSRGKKKFGWDQRLFIGTQGGEEREAHRRGRVEENKKRTVKGEERKRKHRAEKARNKKK